MRLWSIHPAYLDRIGLIALWREGLLAQRVLAGLTRGYRNHPQLERFKRASNPQLAIGTYLYYVYLEGVRRGYKFDLSKIEAYNESLAGSIPVASGQVEYEFRLLLHKLSTRDPWWGLSLKSVREVKVNPIFYVVGGPIESWERPRSFLLGGAGAENR